VCHMMQQTSLFKHDWEEYIQTRRKEEGIDAGGVVSGQHFNQGSWSLVIKKEKQCYRSTEYGPWLMVHEVWIRGYTQQPFTWQLCVALEAAVCQICLVTCLLVQNTNRAYCKASSLKWKWAVERDWEHFGSVVKREVITSV
jgi:hypothetical protein